MSGTQSSSDVRIHSKKYQILPEIATCYFAGQLTKGVWITLSRSNLYLLHYPLEAHTHSSIFFFSFQLLVALVYISSRFYFPLLPRSTMRVAGISALTAHLSLHALSAYAADCYSDNRVTDWSVTDVSKLQGTLSELVTDLCKSTPSTHNDRVSTHEVGNVAFHVVHPPTQSLDYFEECKDSFVNIISQCVSDLSFDGGEAKGVNGTIYKVDFEESAGKKLEARRARGGRTRTARPKKTRPKKTRPKKTTPKKKTPKKTTPKKTTPKKTHPKRPKTRKPHSPKTATKKTRTHKPTKTSSSVRTKPTKSCKQIYALAAKEAKTEALKNEKGAKALTIREDTSGVNIFEKRTAKPGSSTCAFRIMNALDYPDVSEMVCNRQNKRTTY